MLPGPGALFDVNVLIVVAYKTLRFGICGYQVLLYSVYDLLGRRVVGYVMAIAKSCVNVFDHLSHF